MAREVHPACELALVLAHETGLRIGAIRLLRWSDVDLQQGTIRWRGESDKIGFDHETLLTSAAVNALERARRERPSIGDTWLFPSPESPAEPCSRHLLRDWWQRLEALAGVPHQPAGRDGVTAARSGAVVAWRRLIGRFVRGRHLQVP